MADPGTTPFFAAWLNTLQEWVDDLDISLEMLISWVAMAEERFNNELRCLEMVVNRAVMLADQCVPLPDDWLEIISCRYSESGQPLRYVSSDEFFRLRWGCRILSVGATNHRHHLSRPGHWPATRAAAKAAGLRRLPRSVRAAIAACQELLHLSRQDALRASDRG